MERLTQTDRACAVAAALARDFNDELTVILSGASDVMKALEPGHPARETISEVHGAAQRCAVKCAQVAMHNFLRGRYAPRASLAALLEL